MGFDNKPQYVTRTLRLRLKDKHGALLRQQAQAVNMVWNFCNELSYKHWQRKRQFFSAYDMQPYTKGAGKELGLHSQTIQAIQEEYETFSRSGMSVSQEEPKLLWLRNPRPLRAKRQP